MNEAKQSLYGKTIARKVISWLLVLAMMLGLVPNDFSIVAKAAGNLNITVHYQATGWTRPAVQAWQVGDVTLVGDGEEEEVPGWGGAKATPMIAEEDGWYKITITGAPEGFQFLDLDDPTQVKQGYNPAMTSYNEDTPTDLYFIDGTWYLDKNGENELKEVEAKEEYYLVGTISPVAWNAVASEDAMLAKNEDGTYSITIEDVEPGSHSIKVLQDPETFAWDKAWGGTGNGGNYEFEVETVSDVTVTIDPADETHTAVVNVVPKAVVSPDKPISPDTPEEDVISPVYDKENKTITFNIVTRAVSAGIKGSFNNAWQVTDAMDATSYGFTKTYKVPEEPGIYDYGMVTGSAENWAGDPLNTTKISNGNPVFVANPVADNGKICIYYPSAEAVTGKVLYRAKGTTGEYTEAAFKAAEGYDNLYVAEIADIEPGDYEYLVQVGEEEAVADPFNFTEESAFTFTKYIEEPEYEALVLDEENGTVTFNYWNPAAKQVILAGSMNGWANTEANAMEKNEETGLFTKTLQLSFGSYQYKYVVDGAWITDPKNENQVDGNSAFTFGTIEPQVDAETGDVTFTYYAKDYADKVEKADSVSLMGLEGITYVDEDGAKTPCDWNTGLAMNKTEDGNFTITIKNVPAGQYEYKFKANNATWLTDNRNPDGTDNSILTVPGVIADGDNIAGAGTYKFSTKVLGDAKAADAGSEKFSLVEDKTGFVMAEDGTLTVDDTAVTGYFKVRLDYTVDGEEKVSTCQYYYTESAIIYEYEYGANEQYKGQTDIYTWNNAATGTSFKVRNIGTETAPKYAAYITLDKNIESFGYIIRLYGSWGDGDREFTDRTIYVNQGEKYTKYKGGDGIAQPYVCASGKTSYDNGIVFKYRDDQKFHDGTMNTIGEVKVVVNDQTYEMEYSEKDELFTYHMTNMETGDYSYYFLVDGERVEDQYNETGVMHYEKNDASTVAVSYKSTMYDSASNSIVANYDQNPPVGFTVRNKETGEEIQLSKIEVDLAPISGGNSTKVQFSTVTNKGVLYIDRSVAAGYYQVPVSMADTYGNTISTYIPLTVVEKETTDKSWDEARVYFIVTDRFNDGDPTNNGTLATGYAPEKAESYHGGDLKGITEKLSYLQELGINTIWITPIVDNIDWIVNEDLTQTGYHGYWAQDFTKLDEHLGTTEDLDELLDEAHKHGIKVMVDIVVNHSGYARADGTGLENFDGMLRTGDEVGTDFLHGGSNSDLPDFKTEVQEVRDKLIAWQTAWASHTTAAGNSIDYFRVDTVKHVEHETWSELKTALAEVNPYFKMIGEFYGASYNNTGDYLGNGEMDAELDFDFKSIAGSLVNGNIDSAEASLETRNSALTSSVTMGQFLSSHDEDGFVYSQGYDLAKGKLAASLQMTAKGIPVIYYGEEIGLSGPNAFGVKDNNRYDMIFDDLTEEQQSMLTHYKKLLAAREMYSEVFATGTRTKVAGGDEDGYLVFKRGEGADAVYVALNTTDKAKTVTVTLDTLQTVTADTPTVITTMTDVYSGKEYAVEGNTVEITIPSMNNGGTAILGAGETKKLTGIEVVEPTKTTYTVGETLSLANLSVIGIYEGGLKLPIAAGDYEVDCDNVNLGKAGTYTIKVYAADTNKKIYKASFQIKVNEKSVVPTAVPSKVPTVAPTKAPAVTAYTIKYVMNKGTNNKSNPATYSTKDIKLKNPTRKGYTFSGWYTDSKFKTKVTTIKASTKANVTLYAKWTKVKKPAKVTVKSVTNASSKKIKVTLKKKVSGAKGYEIKYTTDKKFKKSVKTVTTTKTTKTISKLTKNKTYYVKVRAYKLDSAGNKVYGSYSKVVKVTIKK